MFPKIKGKSPNIRSEIVQTTCAKNVSNYISDDAVNHLIILAFNLICRKFPKVKMRPAVDQIQLYIFY